MNKSLTLTDDSFTKIIITTDDIPTHTMPNGIIMKNIFRGHSYSALGRQTQATFPVVLYVTNQPITISIIESIII